MTIEHTPTPWCVYENLSDPNDDDPPIIELRSGRDSIGSIWSALEDAEHIVRCVNVHDELLNACMAVAGVFDGHDDVPLYVRRCRAAIAKAEGQS